MTVPTSKYPNFLKKEGKIGLVGRFGKHGKVIECKFIIDIIIMTKIYL